MFLVNNIYLFLYLEDPKIPHLMVVYLQQN